MNAYIWKWLDIPISGTRSNVFLERSFVFPNSHVVIYYVSDPIHVIVPGMELSKRNRLKNFLQLVRVEECDVVLWPYEDSISLLLTERE